jgi:hypothetical protein
VSGGGETEWGEGKVVEMLSGIGEEGRVCGVVVAGCVPGGRRKIVDIEKGAREEIPRPCFLMFDEGDVNRIKHLSRSRIP